MTDLGAIEDDVPFDDGTADTLIAACRTAASAIDGQAGQRASWVTTAMTDFKGRFSELFKANAGTAAAMRPSSRTGCARSRPGPSG